MSKQLSSTMTNPLRRPFCGLQTCQGRDIHLRSRHLTYPPKGKLHPVIAFRPHRCPQSRSQRNLGHNRSRWTRKFDFPIPKFGNDHRIRTLKTRK